MFSKKKEKGETIEMTFIGDNKGSNTKSAVAIEEPGANDNAIY